MYNFYKGLKAYGHKVRDFPKEGERKFNSQFQYKEGTRSKHFCL
jgi:hypothetical protein